MTSTPPIDGRLTLGAAVPPDVAARIAQVRAAATPAPEQAKPLAPRRVAETTSQRNPKTEANRQRHDGPHPIEQLAATFPTVFNIHAPLPLAIGIHNEIIVAIGDAIPHHRIGAVLGQWTVRMNYLGAVAADGSRRVHLDGSDAGEVTDEHRAIAAERLAEKTALTLAPHNSTHATGKGSAMSKINAMARKIKVTSVLDTAAFADMRLPDSAPARSELTVNVNGRKFRADVATKSVRRAVATIAEHGADGVVVLIQGTLSDGDEITEAGLVAQVKAQPAAKAAAA